MKKLLTPIIALVLLPFLAACSQGEAAAAPAPTSVATAEPTAEPVTMTVAASTAAPTAEPTSTPKITLAIAEIKDGTYTGTLSGDSYTNTNKDETYSISPDISSAEITVTIQNGQVELHCTASASADGTILGVEAPRSPSFTRTVSGALPLSQIDETTVRAEGDLTAPEEGPVIYWDKNTKFTHWEIETKEGTYHCVVSIAMADGVPTAEITVDGSKSHRTATVPLQPGTQNAETVQVLWTNGNTGDVRNNAKDYYVKFDLPDCTVTELETCHYLSGGKAPGMLMLFGEDGSEHGPFQAIGREGEGGAANAYWVVSVSIDLPAGRYAIADSDQSTWSNNDATDGWEKAAELYEG